MSSNTRVHTLLSIAALAALGLSFVGCSTTHPIPEGQDPVRWAKNLGDYLNLRNSFINPSEVGRFDKANPWGIAKPVTWPILEQLDGMEEPNLHFIGIDPLPSDLIVEQKEYVVGEGDYLGFSVFELVTPGVPFNDQRQVNEVGNVTIQNLGQVHVAGLTPTQIEEKIGQLAVEKGFLLAKGNGNPGPQVSVQLVQSRTRIFNVLGQVGGPGTYNIIGTDFRLVDALALARDIAGGTQPGMDYLYVIRPNKSGAIIKAPVPSPDGATLPATLPATQPSTNPLNNLDRLRSSIEQAPRNAPQVADSDLPRLVRPFPKEVLTLAERPAQQETQVAQAISPLDQAISGERATVPAAATPATVTATAPATGDKPILPLAPTENPGDALNRATAAPPGMIWVDGRWVEVNTPQNPSLPKEQAIAAAAGLLPSRIIRIPITKLKEGETAYNIVIQPGDYIYVPNIEPGEFYLYGHVGRPGVYTITGRKVTLKMAMAAAGGLDAVAIPRRCDLVRRVGNTEVTIQVDLQRIFDGEQPDIYLKANDWINVGTDMIAPFLAVTRNAYRASYGWGFVYDRNLNDATTNTTPAR